MIWRKLFGKKSKKEEVPYKLPHAPSCLFFNNLIKKHTCESKPDIDSLWSPNSTAGIRGHLISYIDHGKLPSCNITIVYNTYDLPDSVKEWRKETVKLLNQKIIHFIDGRSIKTTFYPEVSILIDGTDTPKQKLQTSEFLTIITPHIIHKTQSKPLFNVHFTEGNNKQLLGYYFEGQQSLTIGNHWLDTYKVPSLSTAEFYHLKKTQQGLEHTQNANVQMLKKETGQSTSLVFFDKSGTEKFSISLTPYQPQQESPHPKVQTFHPPKSKESSNPKPKSKQFHIVMRGLLLQKVHFSKFIEGYYVYIEKTGELTFYSNQPVGQFWISNHKIEFTANRINFKINGEAIQPKETILLTEATKIEYHRLIFQFYDHRKLQQRALKDQIGQLGSSMSMIWFVKDSCYWGHVGDTKVFLLRKGDLTQINPQHTNIGFAKRDGLPLPDKETLSQAFISGQLQDESGSIRLDLGVDVNHLACEENDVFFLCSNHVYRTVGIEKIREYLSNEPSSATRKIISEAGLQASNRLVAMVVTVNQTEVD